MDTYLIMLSKTELIIAGIVLAAIIVAIIVGIILSSKRRREDAELAEEEADFYCDLYYSQVMKEAEAKYKAYTTRGYNDRLPNPVEAIGKEQQMQRQLDETDDLAERRKIFEEYLPSITLALARCKAEGMNDIPKKEAAQLKRLMKEYGVE